MKSVAPGRIWPKRAQGVHTLQHLGLGHLKVLGLSDPNQPLNTVGWLPGLPSSPDPLAVCPSGPVVTEPQMPDKDTKAVMGTEDAAGDKAGPDSRNLRPSVFHSIKVPLRAWRQQGQPNPAEESLPLASGVSPSKLLPS